MADITKYFEGEGMCYVLTDDEKKLMDIFAECWEHCHSADCKTCKYRGENKHIKMLLCLSYMYAQRLIKSGLILTPTVDVTPAVHGRWYYNENGRDFGLGAWACSCCDTCNHNIPGNPNINPYIWSGSKFCPNCGAKMDGEIK